MWDQEKLIENLLQTLGNDWFESVTDGLEAIVVHEINGCYDARQRVIFIDSRQTEAEATQQLIMELSNHHNRSIFAQIDAEANTVSRETFIERVERTEFAGVKMVIQAYDDAVKRQLPWAQGGCVYGKMRGVGFDQYYSHVSEEHRERYGLRYDQLRKQ